MIFASRPPRYPTHIPVVVTKGGVAQSGTIVDINAYGACLTGVSDLDRDDQITLRGAVSSSFGSVRWNADDRTGVHFLRPIAPQHLAMLRLRGAAQMAAQPSTEMRAG